MLNELGQKKVQELDETMDVIRPMLIALVEAVQQNLDFEDTLMMLEGAYKMRRNAIIDSFRAKTE